MTRLAVLDSAPPVVDLAVHIDGLTKRYGPTRALNGIRLTIPWNERVALVGPNGAGKTTLLRILATLIRPSSGRVEIGGISIPDDVASLRPFVGFISHQSFLYGELTGRENLLFYGRLYGVPDVGRRIDTLMDALGLGARGDVRVRALSRGLQQRVALARAVLHDPPILLLDEPDTGLDPAARQALEALLNDGTGQARTVIMITHDLDRALALCNRVVVLVDGRIAADLPSAETTVEEIGEYFRGAVRLTARSSPQIDWKEAAGRDQSCAEQSVGTDSPKRPGALGEWVEPTREPTPLRPPVNGEKLAGSLPVNGEGGGGVVPYPAPNCPSWPQAFSTILGKDLLIETRTRELFSGMVLFALLTLLIFNFAFDLRVDRIGAVAPGVLWVAFLFAGILGLGRSFTLEKDQATLDGLLSAPLDRGAIYLAKLVGNLIFMGIVELITLPAFAILFNLGIALPELAVIAVLGTAGFAAVGTIFAAISANTRAREMMLPLLLFPISIPVVIASVKTTALVFDQAAFADHLPWLELLAGFDLLFTLICFALFDFVVEE